MKGLENISVSRFIPILFTFPLLTILLSALLLKEKIRPEVVTGTVLIVVGIWILSRGKSIKGEKNIKLGVSVAVLAAFLYSFSIVATKTGLKDVDPFQSALISMICFARTWRYCGDGFWKLFFLCEPYPDRHSKSNRSCSYNACSLKPDCTCYFKRKVKYGAAHWNRSYDSRYMDNYIICQNNKQTKHST